MAPHLEHRMRDFSNIVLVVDEENVDGVHRRHCRGGGRQQLAGELAPAFGGLAGPLGPSFNFREASGSPKWVSHERTVARIGPGSVLGG